MRHVIWDWNGTLVDDLPVVVDAVNVSLAGIGEPPITADQYRDHYTRPVRRFYDGLLGREITDTEWASIDAVFHETYSATVDRVPLAADARAAIEMVAAAGGTQSILSMWWHTNLVPEVTRHGLGHMMVRVEGSSGDAGQTKAGLLRSHLASLGERGRPVLIGDATDDARAALEVGIDVVLYDGGSHHEDVLRCFGVPIARSLVEAVTIGLGRYDLRG
jgi:phosphoglycolate phosphatase-like HAD superfamily hydrolase